MKMQWSDTDKIVLTAINLSIKQKIINFFCFWFSQTQTDLNFIDTLIPFLLFL